jgi:hypothetical protein
MQDKSFDVTEIDIEELETRLEMTSAMSGFAATPAIGVVVRVPIAHAPPPTPSPTPSPTPTPDPSPSPTPDPGPPETL